MYRPVGLGKLYTIGTDVPLVGAIQADIPIEAMTLDALAVVKDEARGTIPWIALGLAGVTIVSVAVAGAFFLGRRG
jgi:hypothetical protein